MAAKHDANTGKPKNVIQALARVMEELPGIGKDNNSEQGYKYRGIEAITAHAQTLLGKYGVVFVPEVQERAVKDFTINNRPWTEDCLKVTYTVYGPGGLNDKITVGPIYGLGRDNSDKGVNKSMTQAFKYALLQVLCIGDSKDDADRDVAREGDAVNQRAPMPPEVYAVATQWPSVDNFDRGHQEYFEAIKQLDRDKKELLKSWKAERNYGAWMTPEEHTDTMSAIRDLTNGSKLGQENDPQPAEQQTPEAPETPEEAQPTPEEPTPAPEPETATQPSMQDSAQWQGAAIHSMSGREVMEALRSVGLSASGNVAALRERLQAHVAAIPNRNEPVIPDSPVEKCQFCGEYPCECAETRAESAQIEPDKAPEVSVDNYAEDDPGRPFD